MAKSKKSPESTEQTEGGAVVASGPVSITISGLTFAVPSPYAEGHVLTAQEAATLNQVLHENLRNNFSTKVKTTQKAAETAGQPLDLAALQAEFETYASSYTFQGKRTSRAPLDPVAREAHKIAKTIVLNALKGKGIEVKNLAEGQLDTLIGNLVAKNPAIREEAARRVESTKAAAATSLADLGLDMPATEPQAAVEAQA